jgi:hypothetical protein
MEQMLEFCKLMFGLRPDCDRELATALREGVGVHQGRDGLLLRWQLLYLDAHCV